MDNLNFAPQGWQCPICKRVYAPNTPMCWYCGGESTTSTHSTGDVDLTKHDPVITTSTYTGGTAGRTNFEEFEKRWMADVLGNNDEG